MHQRLVSTLAVGTIALAATVARANAFLPVDLDHTSATFTISHLTLTKVSGQIPMVKSEITVGDDNLPTMVDATLNAAQIETQDENRDKDLRSAKWFNTEKFPTITFRSTKITHTGGMQFSILGNLTMHGITKPVTLVGTYNGTVKDPSGHTKLGYSATGTVNRTAFDIGHAPAAIVGDDVSIDLQVEAAKK